MIKFVFGAGHSDRRALDGLGGARLEVKTQEVIAVERLGASELRQRQREERGRVRLVSRLEGGLIDRTC